MANRIVPEKGIFEVWTNDEVRFRKMVETDFMMMATAFCFITIRPEINSTF